MFGKLAKKYNAPNPLVDNNKTVQSVSAPSSAASLFGSAPKPMTSQGFGSSIKSPFGQSTAPPTSTAIFGGTNKSPFGQTAAPSASTPFGQKTVSSSPFGQSPPVASTPFGQSTAASSVSIASTPFGQAAPTTSTPFGTNNISSGEAKFGGKTAREILVSFYQQRNPAQLTKVDQVLAKYAGKEEQLLLNLAKKYNMDPAVFGLKAAAAPPTSGFGSPTPSFGQTLGFGSNVAAPSPFGQSAGFGGMDTQTASAPSNSFGTFGQASQSVGGFGSLSNNAPSTAFGGAGFSSPPVTSPFGSARR
jgi:hypothetical protein